MTTYSHQLLVVRDIARSIVYFESYCGLVLLHRRTRSEPKQNIAWLGSQPTQARIILAEGPDLESPIGPYGHVGLSCASRTEYAVLLEAAQRNGLIERGPHSQPWPICDWFSILDPDGNRIEISFGQDADFPSEQSQLEEAQ